MASSAAVVTSPFDDPMAAIGATPGPALDQSDQGGLSTAVTADGTATDWRSALSPDRPLFWGFALLGATFGLIFASTSIRVGPFRASASAGRSTD